MADQKFYMQPQSWTTTDPRDEPRGMTGGASARDFRIERLQEHHLQALDLLNELEARRAATAQAEAGLDEAFDSDDAGAVVQAGRAWDAAREAYHTSRDRYDFHNGLVANQWSGWNTTEVIQLGDENERLKHHVSCLESRCEVLESRADVSSGRAYKQERKTQALEDRVEKLASQVEETNVVNAGLREKMRYLNCRVGCAELSEKHFEGKVDILTSLLRDQHANNQALAERLQFLEARVSNNEAAAYLQAMGGAGVEDEKEDAGEDGDEGEDDDSDSGVGDDQEDVTSDFEEGNTLVEAPSSSAF